MCPQLTADEAFSFFSEAYKYTPHTFLRPEWMLAPNLPDFELETDEIEVQAVIKYCKSRSSPSPINRIPYQVFKRCPALQPALLDLFNICWANSTVRSTWKTAGIKLLGKSSAIEDPFTPSNFRPIAITSCIGKLFTSVLKNRWLDYMLSNGVKAFMTATPGMCITSHHVGFYPQ